MKKYKVGGAVRDALLGRPVSDVDWVVVGATPEDLARLGYRPVGKDFPVFLHPQTHEEVALARTERKTAPGYHGFEFYASPEVTLEEDLARRDLTINAMAQDDAGQIIDPYGGQRDLQDGVLRHVSDAFAEDPVRILRVARFAARFPDFRVAPETRALMREMVQAGEVNALVSERVWQEIARGLMEAKPSRMFEVLRDGGALVHLAPEIEALWGVPQPPQHHPEIDTGAHVMLVLDHCASQGHPLEVRFACLCHDLGKGLTPAEQWPRHVGHDARGTPLVQALCQRWRVPNDCRELAELVTREHTHLHQSMAFGAEARLRLLERCDALRRPDRFAAALLACECDARGRLGFEDTPYPQRERLMLDLKAVQELDQAAISAAAMARGLRGPQVGQAIQEARVEALRRLAASLT